MTRSSVDPYVGIGPGAAMEQIGGLTGHTRAELDHVRTLVARHAHDPADELELLAMLGLDQAQHEPDDLMDRVRAEIEAADPTDRVLWLYHSGASVARISHDTNLTHRKVRETLAAAGVELPTVSRPRAGAR